MLNFFLIQPQTSSDNVEYLSFLQEYLIFGLASLVVNGYLSLEYYSVHTIVLDPSMDQYSVYKGDTLIVTQHCHNIYLRLMSKRAGEL